MAYNFNEIRLEKGMYSERGKTFEQTLEALDLDTVESAGYSFQLEMNHRAWKRGFTIREIPIVFTDRVAGCSKITPGIALESIRIALRLRFRS